MRILSRKTWKMLGEAGYEVWHDDDKEDIYDMQLSDAKTDEANDVFGDPDMTNEAEVTSATTKLDEFMKTQYKHVAGLLTKSGFGSRLLGYDASAKDGYKIRISLLNKDGSYKMPGNALKKLSEAGYEVFEDTDDGFYDAVMPEDDVADVVDEYEKGGVDAGETKVNTIGKVIGSVLGLPMRSFSTTGDKIKLRFYAKDYKAGEEGKYRTGKTSKYRTAKVEEMFKKAEGEEDPSGLGRGGKPRGGNPKTDEERSETHEKKAPGEELPPRGTGLKNKGNEKDDDKDKGDEKDTEKGKDKKLKMEKGEITVKEKDGKTDVRIQFGAKLRQFTRDLKKKIGAYDPKTDSDPHPKFSSEQANLAHEKVKQDKAELVQAQEKASQEPKQKVQIADERQKVSAKKVADKAVKAMRLVDKFIAKGWTGIEKKSAEYKKLLKMSDEQLDNLEQTVDNAEDDAPIMIDNGEVQNLKDMFGDSEE